MCQQTGHEEMNSAPGRKHYYLFWLLALFGVCADQASKYGVFNALYTGGAARGEVEIVPGAFKLLAQYTAEHAPGEGRFGWLRELNGEMLPHVNHGALFGFGGRNDQGTHANLLFAIISFVAATAIIV